MYYGLKGLLYSTFQEQSIDYVPYISRSNPVGTKPLKTPCKPYLGPREPKSLGFPNMSCLCKSPENGRSFGDIYALKKEEPPAAGS